MWPRKERKAPEARPVVADREEVRAKAALEVAEEDLAAREAAGQDPGAAVASADREVAEVMAGREAEARGLEL